MKNTYRVLSSYAVATLFFWLIFWQSAATADQVIEPFNANYRAQYFGIAINATRELKKRDDNTMVLSFRAQSFFVDIDEYSTLVWQGQTPLSLRPINYQYRRTGIGKNRHTQMTFDWQAKKIIDLETNSQITIPANTAVFDQLSYQLQLQYDLINGNTEFDYFIVDDQKLKNYRFRVVGEELLTTKRGKLAAVKVERVRNNDKRTTYIWFAKKWNYLMVQLEQREEASEKYRIQLLNGTVSGVDVIGK